MSNEYLKYSKLNNHYDNLRNYLPSNFFNKFQNISDVRIGKSRNDKLIDADNLNWFLNNLKCLKILSISNVSLDQHFFNNLPITIKELSIFYSKSFYLNINFDFIFKFDKLIEFKQVGCSIDLFDLALTSFLKYLEQFEFEYKDENITIEKEGKSFYFNGNHSDVNLDYDQSVRECK